MSKCQKERKDENVASRTVITSKLLLIPVVLLRCIYTFVQPRENCRARRVCKDFKTHLNHADAFCPDMVEWALGYQDKIIAAGMRKCEKLSTLRQKLVLQFQPTLKCITLRGPVSVMAGTVEQRNSWIPILNDCTKLQKLVLGQIVSIPEVLKPFLGCSAVQNLRDLELDDVSSAKSISQLAFLPPNLETLKIQLFAPQDGAKPSLKFSKAWPRIMPRLKGLQLGLSRAYTLEADKEFITPERFPMLTSLHLVAVGAMPEQLGLTPKTACALTHLAVYLSRGQATQQIIWLQTIPSPSLLSMLQLPQGSTTLTSLAVDEEFVVLDINTDYRKLFPNLKTINISPPTVFSSRPFKGRAKEFMKANPKVMLCAIDRHCKDAPPHPRVPDDALHVIYFVDKL